MTGLLDAALADPWRTLDTLLDGPLHPGGAAATARLLDRAGVDDGTRLLDIGCGAGDALVAARDRGADAVGLDPAPVATRGGRTLRGTGTALPVRDGTVDVVLAECVLCLTDLPAALEECRRVLAPGGRLALSDVVVDGTTPTLPSAIGEALCLTGARSREDLTAALGARGFAVDSVCDHREDLLTMRDRVRDRIDYEGLLGLMGERGRELRDGITTVENAVDEGRVSYVSVVARRPAEERPARPADERA
jgi:SAM-dependent methyltransferase